MVIYNEKLIYQITTHPHPMFIWQEQTLTNDISMISDMGNHRNNNLQFEKLFLPNYHLPTPQKKQTASKTNVLVYFSTLMVVKVDVMCG